MTSKAALLAFPPSWGQACISLSLIGWRVVTQPPSSLWRDWTFIVSSYWLIVAIKPGSPFLPRVTATATAYLLAIYVTGQFPHTLRALNIVGP